MRVGVVADLPEEGWPTMDLVATMLHAALRADGVAATLIRPAMARRFSRPDTMRGRGYTADRLVNRWWDYPRVLRRARRDADVFHVTDHSYAHLLRVLPARRTVVTCHDLDTFRSVLEPAAEPRAWPFRAMTRRILAGFRAAARVVCDSEATAAAVVRHGLVPAARLRVVPLGVHPAFARRDPAAGRALERRLGEPGGRVEILHVGSTIARKRIDMLLEVFAGIRRRVPGARLFRVGGAFTEAQQARVARLGLAGDIVVLPWLDWDELAALYGRAALVLVTSEREGFGLPVLEGLARGTPVVASDIPALRETGGALATYRPVGDVEAWVSAALAHLDETDDAARPIEGEARIAHASKFTWSDCARRMADVYREVLAESGG